MLYRGTRGQEVDIMGYAAKDAEVFDTKGDESFQIAKFSIPTPSNYQDGDDETTMWYNVVAFKHKAKYLANVKKGNLMRIKGYQKSHRWEDDDGGKHERTELICTEAWYLTPKGEVKSRSGGGSKSDDGKGGW